MELQNDTGRIVLLYYAKSVNIIAGGRGGGIVTNDKGGGGGAPGCLQQQHRTNHLARIYHLMVVSELTDKGCIIWLYITTTLPYYILINVKGKGFQFYTFTFA